MVRVDSADIYTRRFTTFYTRYLLMDTRGTLTIVFFPVCRFHLRGNSSP